MDVKVVLIAALLLVDVSGINTTTVPPSEGCIATTELWRSTYQDEMDMWVARQDRDVLVKVDHSGGSCELRFNDPDLDDKWVHAKLGLKDRIRLLINGTAMLTMRGCVQSVRAGSIKTVRVYNALHLLPACTEGPAVYEVSKASGNVVIPWYGEEARLLLEPQEDTHIAVQVGGQELVLCSSKGHIAALHNATACTGGVATAGLTVTIPKSNTLIKVVTSDGQAAETDISDGVAGVPPTVKNTLITGTVTVRQCLAQCTSAGPGVADDSAGSDYFAPMVVFLLLSAGLAAAVAYLLYRNKVCGSARHSAPASHPDDCSPEKKPLAELPNGHAAADETTSNGQQGITRA